MSLNTQTKIQTWTYLPQKDGSTIRLNGDGTYDILVISPKTSPKTSPVKPTPQLKKSFIKAVKTAPIKPALTKPLKVRKSEPKPNSDLTEGRFVMCWHKDDCDYKYKDTCKPSLTGGLRVIKTLDTRCARSVSTALSESFTT